MDNLPLINIVVDISIVPKNDGVLDMLSRVSYNQLGKVESFLNKNTEKKVNCFSILKPKLFKWKFRHLFFTNCILGMSPKQTCFCTAS